MENRQKEIMKQSRKKMGAFNSYASPKMLAKKISDSELPHAKKVEKENDTFVSKSDKYTTSIPLTATGDIVLKETIPKSFKKANIKQNNYNFKISLPNKENNTFSGKAKIVQSNSIVFEDYQENVDVVVQSFGKGAMRILTILNDADAPTKYIYTVKLPQGGSMKKLKNGAIAILDKEKKFMGGFAPAWAIDKKGKKIPTHYEVRKNKLIQIVEHLTVNATYPITADPYRGHQLIDTWSWEKLYDRQGRHYYHDWKLSVYTTYWARVYIGNYYAGLMGWYELYNKARTHGLTENLLSMRNQYICHAVYASWLPREYHLEEFRPVVSWRATVNAYCNPPGHIDHN